MLKLFYFLTDSSPHDYQSSLTSVYTASPVDESTVWQQLLFLDLTDTRSHSVWCGLYWSVKDFKTASDMKTKGFCSWSTKQFEAVIVIVFSSE